jgi:hypothetical protein
MVSPLLGRYGGPYRSMAPRPVAAMLRVPPEWCPMHIDTLFDEFYEYQ